MTDIKKQQLVLSLREIRDQVINTLYEYAAPEVVIGFHYSVRDHNDRSAEVVDSFSVSNLSQESTINYHMIEVSKDLERIRKNGAQGQLLRGTKLTCIDDKNFEVGYKDVPKAGETYTIKDAVRSIFNDEVYLRFEEIDAGGNRWGYRSERFIGYEAYPDYISRFQ